MADRAPVPPAFRAPELNRRVDWYAIRLRFWRAKLIAKAARYSEMEFPCG